MDKQQKNKVIFAAADRLIAVSIISGGRKVRTPKRSIAGNTRRVIFLRKNGLGQVQQKVCTGNAVVKPGKLYAVKYQVYQHLRASRSLLKGR